MVGGFFIIYKTPNLCGEMCAGFFSNVCKVTSTLIMLEIIFFVAFSDDLDIIDTCICICKACWAKGVGTNHWRYRRPDEQNNVEPTSFVKVGSTILLLLAQRMSTIWDMFKQNCDLIFFA